MTVTPIRILRETHDTPPSVARRLKIAGGTNRFGDANYRAVWGWNRLTWIGGKWEDRDEQGSLIREVNLYRREPKYTPLDRWHIERWMPPEEYGSPLAWYGSDLEKELGPYPWRGEYELSFTLQTPEGAFIQLTPTVAEYIATRIEFSRTRYSRTQARAALDDAKVQEDKQFDSYAWDVLGGSGAMPDQIVAA